MPDPCQNERAQPVIDGHSGSVRRRSDLASAWYLCRSNKPDKEVIAASGVKQRLTVAGFPGAAWPIGPRWPHFGLTGTLNVAAYRAAVNGIPPGQPLDEQVEDTSETLFGSDVQVGSLPACPSPASSDETNPRRG